MIKPKRMPFQALQKAVRDLLNEHITLENGNIVPVFDYIPTKTKPPYIIFSDIDIADDSAKGSNIYAVDMEIDVYSTGQTRREINGILDDAATLLTSYAVDMSQDKFQVIEQNITDAQTSPSNEFGYTGILHVHFLIQDMEG